MATKDAAIVMTYSKANISYCGISNSYNSIYDCVGEIIMHRQMPLEACIVLQSMLEVMHDTFIVLSRVQLCSQNLLQFDK